MHDSGLQRRLGLGDAVVIGLGAMLGAGVFSAFAPAAGAAGTGILLALGFAAVVAYCNAMSSARLAALHPAGRRHVRLRPTAARPGLGVPGRLVVRRRQDRERRGDGSHRGGVRLASPSPTRRPARHRPPDGRQLLRHHENRGTHQGAGHRHPPRPRDRRPGREPRRRVRRPAPDPGRRHRSPRGASGGRSAVLRLRRVCPDRHPRRGGPRPRAHDRPRHSVGTGHRRRRVRRGRGDVPGRARRRRPWRQAPPRCATSSPRAAGTPSRRSSGSAHSQHRSAYS